MTAHTRRCEQRHLANRVCSDRGLKDCHNGVLPGRHIKIALFFWCRMDCVGQGLWHAKQHNGWMNRRQSRTDSRDQWDCPRNWVFSCSRDVSVTGSISRLCCDAVVAQRLRLFHSSSRPLVRVDGSVSGDQVSTLLLQPGTSTCLLRDLPGSLGWMHLPQLSAPLDLC